MVEKAGFSRGRVYRYAVATEASTDLEFYSWDGPLILFSINIKGTGFLHPHCQVLDVDCPWGVTVASGEEITFGSQ